MSDLNAVVREAVNKGIEEWIADGRESFRPVVAAIPDVAALVIDRLAADPRYLALLDVLAKGERDAEAMTDLIALAREAFALLVSSGLLAGA